MNEFEKNLIYEFIENKYDELFERDGKYYSSKHDIEAFEFASEKFSISVKKLNEIYNEVSEIIANNEISEVNKLPLNMREKKMEEMFANILKNNGDLPFCNIDGEATEKIVSGNSKIYDRYFSLCEKLGELGWTIPMGMGLKKFDELLVDNLNDDELEIKICNHFTGKIINNTLKHVNNSSISGNKKDIYSDAIELYQKERYVTCITLLIPVLEGLLSEYDDDRTNIRMIRICRYNFDKTKNENKLIKNLLWKANLTFISNLYKNSKFNESEPENNNRHWILHGRTEKEYSKNDCLRIINAIHSFVTILKYRDN